MKQGLLILAGCALIACGGDAPQKNSDPVPAPLPATVTEPGSNKVYARVDLPNLDDNVKHDTLLIYTTHDLGDGTFIMAAKHQDAADDMGLRLYRYRARPDSSAEILAVSQEGKGSYVMLPVYFRTDDPADGWIIITNMGERQSWGQEAFWLRNDGFTHLGWIDVAKREWKTENDSVFQWRTSIAPYVTVRADSGRFVFGFTGDSLQVYDDQRGGIEVMHPAPNVGYRYDHGNWMLLINGEAREVKVPS